MRLIPLTILYVAMVTAMYLMMDNYYKLPTVEVDVLTRQCSQVVTHTGEIIPHGCDNLPSKYHRAYVSTREGFYANPKETN